MAVKKKNKHPPKKARTLDARPDTPDFRDRMFEPTLVEVPTELPLAAYRQAGVPILDQGEDGACTGFGLATVCNYLLRVREVKPDTTPVSPAMLYDMARRYDEWAGENYEGSSARGAMKGWFKHGVCSAGLWPHKPTMSPGELTTQRAADAAGRPLGAYMRVNHRDLIAIHAALAEVRVLYATALVHSGWNKCDSRSGRIPYDGRIEGGHAFAIVGYDRNGFWIQNSWGTGWGKGGFGHISYADWLDHGTDLWVARLGVPMEVNDSLSVGAKSGGIGTSKVANHDLRPHIISIGNGGALRESGTFGNTATDVHRFFTEDFPRITRNWKTRRILLYAHGGLVSEDGAIQRVADYLQPLLDAEIYPVAFIWKTDFWTTLKNILDDAVRRRRTEGVLDDTKDFMLDRLDDLLEPVARLALGKASWDEMKENGAQASMARNGGARIVAREIAALSASSKVHLHAAGHSAGSILMAPLVQLLTSNGVIPPAALKGPTGLSWQPDDEGAVTGLGLSLASVTMWAPACTLDLFKAAYLPAAAAGTIQRFALFGLNDETEQDDNCASIYNKSLLYLVSNAFESKPRVPLLRDGAPILGMNKFVQKDRVVSAYLQTESASYVLAPNQAPIGSTDASRARHHGDFDDDEATVRATMARILAQPSTKRLFGFRRSASSIGDRRRRLAR